MACLPGRRPFVRSESTPPGVREAHPPAADFALSECGSTPEPESRTARRIGRPSLSLRPRTPDRRRRGVVDPEAERERTRFPAGRRVEYEVVVRRLGQHRSDDRLRLGRSLVRVQARRDPGVADDAVLVVGARRAAARRRTPRALRRTTAPKFATGRRSVNRKTCSGPPSRVGTPGRETTLRIAIRGDARRFPGRVAAIEARPCAASGTGRARASGSRRGTRTPPAARRRPRVSTTKPVPSPGRSPSARP